MTIVSLGLKVKVIDQKKKARKGKKDYLYIAIYIL